MKPTDEQIKEFWEWCGFERLPEGNKDYHFEKTVKVMNWTHPKLLYGFLTNLPRIDLDNLFEYAVTKLMYDRVLDGFECHIDSRRDGLGYQWIIGDRYRANTYRTGEYITDNALALFWAIWKVMHDDTT